MSVIDFHAHILPGADHGSNNVTTSLFQLSASREAGIEYVVATPHFYATHMTTDAFLERREKCFLDLKNAIAESGAEAPQIILGAEVLYFNGIERLPDLRRLCIEGTDVLLLELPFNDWDDSFPEVVESLRKMGIRTLLAHADRYPPEHIDMFLDAGAMLQLNVSSLCGLFINKHLKTWIRDGLVYGFGSDIHGMDKNAYRRFVCARKKFASDVSYIDRQGKNILFGE